jgi:hypothetical protein
MVICFYFSLYSFNPILALGIILGVCMQKNISMPSYPAWNDLPRLEVYHQQSRLTNCVMM